MSVKVRRFALKVLASASEASLRTLSSGSCSLLRVGSMGSSSPRTVKRKEAMVSSNRRFQAERPVTDFSWKSCSILSSS